MKCPNCATETRVVDSRVNPNQSIRRRRACPKCGGRFSTMELPIEEENNAAWSFRTVSLRVNRPVKLARVS